ncbi:MAG TPA: hypothetical protein VM429_14810 [Micropruina sp.]|nr:hypothetical protein [Micropruina sp.]
MPDLLDVLHAELFLARLQVAGEQVVGDGVHRRGVGVGRGDVGRTVGNDGDDHRRVGGQRATQVPADDVVRVASDGEGVHRLAEHVEDDRSGLNACQTRVFPNHLRVPSGNSVRINHRGTSCSFDRSRWPLLKYGGTTAYCLQGLMSHCPSAMVIETVNALDGAPQRPIYWPGPEPLKY